MPPRPRQRQRRYQTSEASVVEEIVTTLYRLVRHIFRSRGRRIDVGAARHIANHWSGVETLLEHRDTEALAVSEADKLLDAALKAMNYDGATMADRLRNAETHFGRQLAQEVWRAHKLRNQLAHEVGTSLAPGQAHVAVRTFRTALKNLGVSL